MEFQVQKFIQRDLTEQERDQLDLYVSLKTSLGDPFNVFLRVKDIQDKSDIIYFYAYSLGKKKVIIWGIYDQKDNEFLIDDACKYQANDLKGILDTWKNHDYNFFFSGVKDRIKSSVLQNLLFVDRKSDVALFTKFKEYFLVKLARSGFLTGFEKNPLFKDENFDNNYNIILNKVVNETLSALTKSNLKDQKKVLEVLYDQIESLEAEEIIRTAVLNNFRTNSRDPYISNIIKYFLATLFIMIFADIDEYRSAKYILYLNDKKGEQIRKLLKGSFLYEWILELSRILRVYDLKSFMHTFAKSIVDYLEVKINRTDIGVIGDRNMIVSPIVEDLATFFEDFISKSIYSKISYLNNIPFCPEKDKCEGSDDLECQVYTHGFKSFSKYDLT